MNPSLSPKDVVKFFLDKGILLSGDALNELSDSGKLSELAQQLEQSLSKDKPLVLNKDFSGTLFPQTEISWADLERAKAMSEKGKDLLQYRQYLDLLQQKKAHDTPAFNVRVVSSFAEDSKKREVQDFTQYFSARFKSLSAILLMRPELNNCTAINRILQKKDKESVSFVGMVSSKETTKNDNLILSLEDSTGIIKVIINKNKPELYAAAKSIVMDEVLGVVGTYVNGSVFGNSLYWPDLIKKEMKKSQEEGYALFLSDLHVGSKNFLGDAFEKFLSWINQESGSDQQKAIAKQVKYIFIVGDLVDGCSIYPSQEKELTIHDIYEQYQVCAKLLARIPKHIPVIISPGNHDAVRLEEPQPQLYEDLAKAIITLPNAILVSNPATINIHSSPTFSGFDVLLYHGYSYDFYIANVDEIRNCKEGGYNRADLVMKFLLQRRHLAPTHHSTVYVPMTAYDPLIISHTPDFFISGHLHKSAIAHYKNITLICGSCWQSKTAFQEKVGHNPDPGKVPAINLQTREIKVLKFL
ncbi:DNA-directed DNA polymerase II small subunit [Candidatus Woesearchaeota archaeon]|nr:DNA-directed DNA polymerase II small subunit [Candidatus Woesearchaeota archaeon]